MKLSEKCVLYDVAVIDGNGNEPREHQAILLKDGMIEEIVSIENLSKSDQSDYQVVDFSGKYVMPGMIDAHTHLCGAIANLIAESFEDVIMQALHSIPQAQALLCHGFTGVRDLSVNGCYLKRLFAEGPAQGPKMVVAGPGLAHPSISVEGQKMGAPNFRRLQNELIAQGKDDICRAVALLFSNGVDHIKFFANGSTICPTDRTCDQYFTLDEMKTIVAQARKVKGAKVLAHIMENRTAKDCLAADIDTFEHSGYLDEELCEGMKKGGKYLIPTLYLGQVADEFVAETPVTRDMFYARDMYFEMVHGKKEESASVKKWLDDFKMAHEMGVNIALGSDSIASMWTPYGATSLLELKDLCTNGMTPLEAIRSATRIGAEVMGLEQYIGTVEPNKIADLLVLDKNPADDIDVLADIDNHFCVIQNGQITVERGKLV